MHFSKEDLRDLFVFNSRTVSSTHDLLHCRCCEEEEEEEEDAEDGGGVKAKDSASKGDSDSLNEHFEGDRKCGLFQSESTSSKKKIQGISELMDWRHIPTPFPEGCGDDLLIDSQDDISMIFRNVTHKEA